MANTESIPTTGVTGPEKHPKWRIALLAIIAAIFVALSITAAIALRGYFSQNKTGIDWWSERMLGIYIAVGISVVALLFGWFLIKRKAVRPLSTMRKELIADHDIHDFLIIFGWTPKILYMPSIIAAAIAIPVSILAELDFWFFGSMNPNVISGAWFAIFFLNYCIEEFELSIKVMLISLALFGLLLFWLHLFGWAWQFLKLYRHVIPEINSIGYLLIVVIGLMTIMVSWLKGQFHYVAITSGVMNVQNGLTEHSDQVGREDFNTQVNTIDFFERLLGFGRIEIHFRRTERRPMSLLVWNIRKKAEMLERVRSKIAVDRPD